MGLAAGAVEVLSPVFGFVFVGVAALIAAGLAALGAPFLAQLAAFSVALLVLLLFLRPRFSRALEAQGVSTRTQALVGRRGTVSVAIDPVTGLGRIAVDGQDWAATSDVPLPAGAPVRVDSADGIVLHVSGLEAE